MEKWEKWEKIKYELPSFLHKYCIDEFSLIKSTNILLKKNEQTL